MGSRTVRVAVLGAGIMGSSVALFLARKGARVTLIDAAPRAFWGASRWNEGKIHLGYLYSGDPTLETARLLLRGALSFKPLTEELIGCSLAPATTADDEVYLVHRDSVVTPEAMGRYFEAVTGLVRAAPNAGDYLVDASACATEPLSRRELESLADAHAIVAGFRVPERSVWTSWVADRYLGAIEAEPRIELLSATRVTAVRPAETTVDGRWRVVSDVRRLWRLRFCRQRAVGKQTRDRCDRWPASGARLVASLSPGGLHTYGQAGRCAQRRDRFGAVRRCQELYGARLLPLMVSGRSGGGRRRPITTLSPSLG